MPIRDVPVSVAVGGRETDRAGTESRIDLFIGDDGYMNRDIAKDRIVFFADKFFIARIVWVHSDADIAHLGFRARRCDRNREVLTVAEGVERGGAFLVDDLVVRDGRLTLRVPVDDAQSAINKSGVIHFFKDLAYGVRARLIKGEGLA